MAEEKKTYKFVCTVCGYEVEVDTPELPEDYVCPVCGVGPDQFELVEEQLAGTRRKPNIALSKGSGRILGRDPFDLSDGLKRSHVLQIKTLYLDGHAIPITSPLAARCRESSR